jgi:uncharacterized membrane protein
MEKDAIKNEEKRSTGDPQLSSHSKVVEKNIRTLLARRQMEEEEKGIQDRIADAITRFTGSMPFVYLHAILFGIWIVVNIGWIPSVPRFDSTFVILAMFASVEAIFLSTFVLISQNRMAAINNKRADLDLQISLLAEHEITQLIKLTSLIAEKMQIRAAKDPELNELSQDVRPEQVLNTIEDHTEKPKGG